MAYVRRPLKRYRSVLMQTAANQWLRESHEIPDGQALLLKQVLVIFYGYNNPVNPGDHTMQSSVWQQKNDVVAQGANNMVITFRLSKMSSSTYQPEQPLVWNPPPGLLIYGKRMVFDFISNNFTNQTGAEIYAYGTLQKVPPREEIEALNLL